MPSNARMSKKPAAYLLREVQPDWSGFFSKLSSFDLTKPLGWPLVIHGTLTSLFKLKPRDEREEAFLLVKKSIAGAIAEIVKEAFAGDGHSFKRVKSEFSEKLDNRLSHVPIELNSNFYKFPGRVKVIGEFAKLLASWLREAGLTQNDADFAVLSLAPQFTLSLARELEDYKESYPKIWSKFEGKLSWLLDLEDAWSKYHIELLTNSNPPVLNLEVSLDDVYVELRCFTETEGIRSNDTKRNEHRSSRTIGLLKDFAEAWIENSDDAIFVVSGGPGAGKSAFARKFAAWRAWAGPEQWRVLFVPLHRFRLGKELKPALNDFAINELQNEINLFNRADDIKLLIVFDGLDELAQRGKVGEELAADFFRQVDEFVKDCNRDAKPNRVMVMLCGRPVAVINTKAEVRKQERVRHILPYRIDVPDRHREHWVGQESLLDVDQRDEWWGKYGKAIGDDAMVSMPDDIRTENLDPLTTEPILNGLIAECRKNHKIDASTNRSRIYEWLFVDVLRRVHDKSGRQHLKDANEDDLARLLEEVAVTAWHNGDVRATTKEKVRIRCEATEQTGLLHRVFPDQSGSNISSLFLAFYFQEAEVRDGQDRAFEFSHKSFGEYLLARRILGFIRNVCEKLESEAWDGDVALKKWAELFGPVLISHDLLSFISDMADLETEANLIRWRTLIIRLISRVLTKGMPMHQLGLPTYFDMDRNNRNACVAFFALHSCLFRVGQSIVPFEYHGVPLGLFERLHTVVGLAWESESPFSGFFCGLDLTYSQLSMTSSIRSNFMGANLSNSGIDSTNMAFSNFQSANLSGCVFSSITFSRTNSNVFVYEIQTDLSGANFANANLTDVNFLSVKITGANIEGADLTGAKIKSKQLLETIGKPSRMPNGKAPPKTWKNEKMPKRRNAKIVENGAG